MVDMDRDLERERGTGGAPAVLVEAEPDILHPRYYDKVFAVGLTPDGQWVLLREVPPHSGLKHKQVRTCDPRHVIELQTARDQGLLGFQPGGPSCTLVVWAEPRS